MPYRQGYPCLIYNFSISNLMCDGAGGSLPPHLTWFDYFMMKKLHLFFPCCEMEILFQNSLALIMIFY